MKIIATHWFSESGGCIGIVVGENEVGDRKANRPRRDVTNAGDGQGPKPKFR